MNYKFICLAAAVFFLTQPAYSQSEQKTNSLGISESEFARFNKFAEEKKYREVLNLLENIEGVDNEQFLYWRGLFRLMYGEDKSSKCKAVNDLERVYDTGNRSVLGILNHAYNGDWASIAALEGEKNAMYRVAERYWHLILDRNSPTYFNPSKCYSEILSILEYSAKLGNKISTELALKVRKVAKEKNIQIIDIRLQNILPVTPIICNIRK